MKLSPILFICMLSTPFVSFGMDPEDDTPPSAWQNLRWVRVPHGTLTIEDHRKNATIINDTLYQIAHKIEAQQTFPHAPKQRVLTALYAKIAEITDHYNRLIHCACDAQYLNETLPRYWNNYSTHTEPILRKLVQDLEMTSSPNIDDALAALENLTL